MIRAVLVTAALTLLPAPAAHATPPRAYAVVVEHCNGTAYQHTHGHHVADRRYTAKSRQFDRNHDLVYVALEHRDSDGWTVLRHRSRHPEGC